VDACFLQRARVQTKGTKILGSGPLVLDRNMLHSHALAFARGPRGHGLGVPPGVSLLMTGNAKERPRRPLLTPPQVVQHDLGFNAIVNTLLVLRDGNGPGVELRLVDCLGRLHSFEVCLAGVYFFGRLLANT